MYVIGYTNGRILLNQLTESQCAKQTLDMHAYQQEH